MAPAVRISMVTALGVVLAASPRQTAADEMAAVGTWMLGALERGARSQAILRFANRWLGTPYRWGGTTRSGIDCSAYLRHMYRDIFRVELPRTTRQQISLGVDLPVDPRNLSSGLEPGDLIFYVDAAGVPNHVVVYSGSDRITHSVSGRGVVVDPISKLYGRRVIARRLLVPGPGRDTPSGGGGYGPIPAAGPALATEIPCPPSFRARRAEVRRFSREPIEDFRIFQDRELCDVRALAEALAGRSGVMAETNVAKLENYAEWLDSLEALKGILSEPQ